LYGVPLYPSGNPGAFAISGTAGTLGAAGTGAAPLTANANANTTPAPINATLDPETTIIVLLAKKSPQQAPGMSMLDYVAVEKA
jgi:hypothetical protein